MSFDFEEFFVEFVRFMSCELLLLFSHGPENTDTAPADKPGSHQHPLGDNEWCSSSAGFNPDHLGCPAPDGGLLSVPVRLLLEYSSNPAIADRREGFPHRLFFLVPFFFPVFFLFVFSFFLCLFSLSSSCFFSCFLFLFLLFSFF